MPDEQQIPVEPRGEPSVAHDSAEDTAVQAQPTAAYDADGGGGRLARGPRRAASPAAPAPAQPGPAGAARRAAHRLRIHRRRARGEGPDLLELLRRRGFEPRLALCGAARERAPAGRRRRLRAGAQRLRRPRGGSGGRHSDRRQVAYISGNTLYVTTAEGNTVKVTTSPATTVTKTVKATVAGIHPGETVTVTGASGRQRCDQRRIDPRGRRRGRRPRRAVQRLRLRRGRQSPGRPARAAANRALFGSGRG